ncbi:4-alpha-glucanotransferase [Melaminivora suipulveris]|uniref:4-alpha-glucanotransferase n=1 Tax=Melaminivora suipulveris TaxID=2109913 RepID=A0A2R3Q849_9BURK|nr:malto-oligosyltrehalose synthase [Melaminivora suipulveris]AVO47956.1 4-alpha-glucanotransferase [Melaminivora suipulveris]
MTHPDPQELSERARRAGIETEFTSFWGVTVPVAAAVLERALAAMGEQADAQERPPALIATPGVAVTAQLPQDAPWQLLDADSPTAAALARGSGAAAALPPDLPVGYYLLRQGAHERLVIAAPARCWLPPAWSENERWWGVTCQLYALRSARNWGVGDFGDLPALVALAAGQGASFVGLSPLHALHPDRPALASPYSPSSRLALNTLFIDVPAVPEFLHCEAAQALHADIAFQQRLQGLRASEQVRYADVAAAKHEMLVLLWQHFCTQEAGGASARGEQFALFARQHARTLGRHALFEAIQLHLHASDPAVWGWPAWPEELQDPHGEAAARFAREHAQAVRWRLWLQWIAHQQLEQASRAARAALPLGLYCDLAVGASEGGSESWSGRGLYARGMHVGAPPDPLNNQGQDWGLPPLNPAALARAHFAPFRQLLAAAMRPAGAVRLDHVMGLMRLFWTSAEGGTYVRYPLAELLAVLAVESHRQRCVVIGEDLGNVAAQMRQAMADQALLSYRPLLFERLEDASFRPPAQWPVQAIAVAGTHDLPTLRGFWAGRDIEVQRDLGWLAEGEPHARALMERAQDRVRLLYALEQQGLLPEGTRLDPQSQPEADPALTAAVHRYLARTPCWLAGVQLEDATGQLEQVNVPGSTEDMQPNWRRRLAVALEDLPAHAGFAAVMQAMRAERAGPRRTVIDQPLPPLASADVPRATYRVQFHAGCTFADVARAVPYLQALGVSHLYSSPYLKAEAGSTHGYDMVDPTQLNPEVGSEAGHEALCAALAAHGMGQVLDIVPNHMGVASSANVWWDDVLQHGPASPHARSFDIDWHSAAEDWRARVLLPVLGDHFGRELEAGRLQLRFHDDTGQLRLHYWDRHWPLDARHTARVLRATPPPPGAPTGSDELAQLQSLLDALEALPPRTVQDEVQRAARVRDAALHRQRLATLFARHAWLREWMAGALALANGQPGEPASFDALGALLDAQAWRLASWRVAADDINYRRFFDINTLAAVRVEEPAVFEASHALVLRWLAEGKVGGLRVDHPDGLAQPAQYFQRLQRRHAELARAAGREAQALYVVVEKILADHEPLPQDWPVHGSTGYRFAALVNALFVDGAAQGAFDDAYAGFIGQASDFDQMQYECKRLIIKSAFAGDLNWLAHTLHRITRADRAASDYTLNQLRQALAEVAAHFPVYRAYVQPDGPASDADRQHIAWAVAAARRRMGTVEGGALTYLQSVLLGEAGSEPQARRDFVRRWQQFTAPVMAKAVEDTLFYRYVPLVSLNDVGAEPRRFGVSPAAFHQAQQYAARLLPHTMLASSTHDSKRSEDVRARLNVLSEMPQLWSETAQRLRAVARRFETEVDGEAAPRPNDLWALYQALVGVWPAQGAASDERAALQERIQQYMVKALREAKLQTNWLFPNEAYEAAVAGYIERALATDAFVATLQELVQTIAPPGFRNSLSQLALKLTAPGVPDIYQGCEQWSFALVDPDNRRPVDFAALAQDLEQVRTLYAHGRHPAPQDWQRLLDGVPPPQAKQLVTWRLLQLRRHLPEVFRDGSYVPLSLDGPASEHAVAFCRLHQGRAVAVVCARLVHGLAARGWQGTRLALPGGHPLLGQPQRWRDWLTGRELHAALDGLALHELISSSAAPATGLPFAVLVCEDTAP